MSEVQSVLDFWFADGDQPRAAWFRKDDAFDAAIRNRFGARVERALAGDFEGWPDGADAMLARIVVLDQFTRNIHRDTPRAFAGDAQALAAARALVAGGADRTLAAVRRWFVYLPFEHAEDRAAQAESMRLFGELAAEHPAMADALEWARRHQVVIERFGRFPHRNLALGRHSTAEEEAFLREPGSRF